MNHPEAPTAAAAKIVEKHQATMCDWSEEEFQNEVIRRAKELGWKHYHTRNSKKSVAGFPDLTLWRERVVFAELKTETGTPSAAQLTTAEELRDALAEVYMWRPSDWASIEACLTRRSPSGSASVGTTPTTSV